MSRLAASGLAVARGGNAVLNGVDFAVDPGEIVGLLGPNGAGKTSLLRVLAGLDKPAAGSVTYEGKPLASHGRAEIARRVAFLPQPPEAAWPIAVEDLVALGRLPFRGPFARPSEDDRAAVDQAIASCELGSFRRRPVTGLSAGEASRAFLARALAGRPALILADEPTANLDPAHQIAAMTVLRQVAAAGGAVVIAQHDLPLAARFCDRLVLIAGGGVVADGPPEAVLTPANLARSFGIRARYPGDPDDGFYALPWTLVAGEGDNDIVSP